MRTKVIVVIVLLLLAAVWQSALVLPVVKASPHTDITVAQAYDMVYSGSYPNLVVIDVRAPTSPPENYPENFNNGHIMGAINVPVVPPSPFNFAAVYAWISSPEGQSHKNDEIIVNCRTGTRSNLTANILEANGFTKVYDMLGGFQAWVAAGYPSFSSVNNDVWFVLLRTGFSETPTWTDGGTVLHNTYNATWRMFRSPVTTVVVEIGAATSQCVLEFNNVTSRGYAVEKFAFNFSDANSTRNPYGVGMLEGTMIANLVALHPVRTTLTGNGSGTMLATRGTGAFAHAMLKADLVLTALGPSQAISEAIFFGTNPNVNGTGRLETNSLKGTYRGWSVLEFDSRIYVIPPATMLNAPRIMSVGTWDSDYYGKLGMTAVDVAKPAIDSMMPII